MTSPRATNHHFGLYLVAATVPFAYVLTNSHPLRCACQQPPGPLCLPRGTAWPLLANSHRSNSPRQQPPSGSSSIDATAAMMPLLGHDAVGLASRADGCCGLHRTRAEMRRIKESPLSAAEVAGVPPRFALCFAVLLLLSSAACRAAAVCGSVSYGCLLATKPSVAGPAPPTNNRQVIKCAHSANSFVVLRCHPAPLLHHFSPPQPAD